MQNEENMEKTVWITGATSGIGWAFARHYAAQGYRLILTGRRVERLQQLQEECAVPCRLLPADLSDEEQCKALLDSVKEEPVEILINNAGFGAAGRFLEIDVETEMNMLAVNDLAMHRLCKGMLQQMADRGHGTIVNVASSAGLFPGGPYMATYYASKAYVVALTRAIAQELREAGSSVRIFALCPGPVDTEFSKRADVVFSLPGITAEQCVANCLKGMEKNKTIIVPTMRMQAATFFQRFLPQNWVVKMVGGQQKKKTGEMTGS